MTIYIVMKANEVLKVLKITRPTLCKYVKTGRVKATRLPNGQLDYDEDSVLRAAGLSTDRVSVVYARVSTAKQKRDLQSQIDTVVKYANENGFNVHKVYSDVASGLSYDRGEFKLLLDDVINRKVKRVFVENKDRLTRVSFDMWRELFKQFGCELTAVNEVLNPKTDEEEIFSDIISLLHCFTMRMYSQRRKNKLRIVKEDLENEIGVQV